jgi:hypothetical protein
MQCASFSFSMAEAAIFGSPSPGSDQGNVLIWQAKIA